MAVTTHKNITVVTTSWDDGHPLDIRLAELLSSYGIMGTFYVPIHYGDNPLLTKHQLLTLRQMGMEIGSHTLRHAILTKLTKDEMLHEMSESKRILEDMCQEVITSICYPGGKFNRTVCSVSREAGYKLARTTCAFRTEIQFNPYCMPVSFQFFPHTHSIHIRHAIKQGNLKGMINWIRHWNMENDLIKIAVTGFDYVLAYGGILHIWGHSWEIEQFGLWRVLEEVLQHVARKREVKYLTNSQVLGLSER